MTLIDCFGDGLARGRAHGEAAREMVRSAIDRWEEATMAGREEPGIRAYAARFLASTGLMAAVERQLPDLAAEVRGIAEASGVDHALVAAYNLMDEQWWYELGVSEAEPGCSTLAISTGSETLLAQNMDLPEFMDGSQVVLRIKAAGEESLVLSSAGLIGLTGVNRHGFAICVNTLLMLNHYASGVPVAFALRGALARRNASDAVDYLRTIRHASGQHYAVADRTGVTGLECSGNGAAVSHEPSGPRMIHTNHPLTSADVDAMSLSLVEARGRVDNSRRRYGALEGAIGGLYSGDDVVAFLSDRSQPICITASPTHPSQTFASMVFELGETVTARFCLGQPGRAEWTPVAFTRPTNRYPASSSSF